MTLAVDGIEQRYSSVLTLGPSSRLTATMKLSCKLKDSHLNNGNGDKVLITDSFDAQRDLDFLVRTLDSQVSLAICHPALRRPMGSSNFFLALQILIL